MPALVSILMAVVGGLILSIKTYIASQKDQFGNPIPDLSPLTYMVTAFAAAIFASVLFIIGNPNLFIGDPLFGRYPLIGALAAAFISVMPPGIGVSVLTIIALRNTQTLPPAMLMSDYGPVSNLVDPSELPDEDTLVIDPNTNKPFQGSVGPQVAATAPTPVSHGLLKQVYQQPIYGSSQAAKRLERGFVLFG